MKKIIMILSGIFLFMFNSLGVNAESSKQLSVDIPKEYVSATFYLSSSEFELKDCIITIVNPDGREYSVDNISGKKAECSINNVKPGKWNIYFFSESLSEIGKIDLKVEGLKTEVANADTDIKVAANITGLALYLRDDYLVVEWNDSACGSVKIQVMDSKTLQVLDNKTVSDKDACYYEYKIPSEYKELLVKVVPSTSASIEGAENVYTMEVYNNPAASIHFEERNFTNLSEYSFEAVLDDSYQLLLMANNKKVNKTDLLPAGKHTLTLPVADGINDYVVYVIDNKGYMKSFSASVIGDFIAPELSVENSSQSFTVNSSEYHIRGNVSDFVSLTVNEKEVTSIYDDGVFEHDYLLHEGNNIITVSAKDEAGNISLFDINILYEIPETLPIGIIVGIVFCVILLVFLIILCIKMMLNKNQSKTDEDKIKSDVIRNFFDKFIGEGNLSKFNWLVTPVLLIISLYILVHYLIAHIIITSASMEPTLKTGDIVFFNRLAYVNNEVERGDIICFWSEEESNYFGKRVIGLPGEKIFFKDGYVCIDGSFMDESMYIPEEFETNCDKTFVVPEGCYFVLGDNREISKDSRYFENPYISQEDIIGKYIGSSGININFFK